MKWKQIQFIIACIALLVWCIYTLQNSSFTSNGFYIPSPDKTMAASIMKVHKTPTFGKEKNYYEISIFNEYAPGKIHLHPILKEKYPLSIASSEFKLSKNSIQWNMKKQIVIFDFGKTKIKKGLKK